MGIVYTVPDPWAAKTNKLRELIPTDKELKNEVTAPLSDEYSYRLLSDSATGRPGDLIRVRRPLAGIKVKPNTHAYLQAVKSDGSVIKVFNELGSQDGRRQIDVDNPDGPQDRYWTDWSLQSVTEAREEKVQITETFGDPVLYVFGERPRFLRFQGFLVNTTDFPWRAQFWENWERYFRATKLVEHDAQLFIGFDEVLVSGYPINANATQVANDPNKIVFSFTFYVVNYINFTMKNAGLLHQLRNVPTLNNGKIVDVAARLNEYSYSGRNADPVLRNTRFLQGLEKVLGGQRLEFQQFIQKIDSGLGGTVSVPGLGLNYNLKDLILSSSLRYIRGGKTAAEVLNAQLVRAANQLAYFGVDELAQVTPGGQAGLQFWFGAAHQLYEIGLNTALAINPNLVGDGRFAALADNMAQMGNPFGVASYMGYAVNASAGAGLRAATGQWDLSNLKYTSDRGLVARGQSSEFGAGALQDSAVFSTNKLDTTTITTAGLTEQQGWESPVSSAGAAVVPGSNSLGDQDFEDKKTAADEEQEAIKVQEDSSQENIGAMNVVDDVNEIEDDGSDEV